MDFSRRVRAPEGVLVQEIAGESVLLNLNTEYYFGLDEVGTRMWAVLTDAPSLEAGLHILLAEYDVDEATLRQDIESLVEELLEHGLLTYADPA